MGHLLNIRYDTYKYSGVFFLNEDAPANCHLLILEGWEDIREKNERFVYYVGSIWYDYSVGVSNHFWKIASDMPGVDFYFKLIEDEKILNSVIPEGLNFHHLPLVVYIDKVSAKLISSGPINEFRLEQLIKEQW
jgi:hypothetical protein